MSLQKECGTVVVGLGIAGKVRVRDLKTETCGLKLKGVVSRRPVEIEGVTAFTFDEAINKSDVKALIICTEPGLHEEYVRKGLENGKHILVEYPVALSSKTAKSLYQLAEGKGLVLQEENIALLTEVFHVVKSKVSQTELKAAAYTLKGSYNGWLENFEKSGLPFVSGISGIQTMLAHFGDMTVVGGKLDMQEDGYMAYADLRTRNGKPITMTLARSKSKDVKREMKWLYEFEDGDVIDSGTIPLVAPSKPGLFMQDMENFYAAIEEGWISEESKQLSIRSYEIAEEIHSFF